MQASIKRGGILDEGWQNLMFAASCLFASPEALREGYSRRQFEMQAQEELAARYEAAIKEYRWAGYSAAEAQEIAREAVYGEYRKQTGIDLWQKNA